MENRLEVVCNHWVLGIRVKLGVRTSTDQEDSNIKDKYRVFHNLYLDCPGPRGHSGHPRGVSPWLSQHLGGNPDHFSLPGYLPTSYFP